MAETEFRFTDGAAYERFMGPWTVKAGAAFLDWLQLAQGLRWLEAGCGTGVFTELLLDRAAPREVVAFDPAPAQIEQAKRKPVASRTDFRVADAQALTFNDDEFDIAASALVINFIPDQARAMAEMRRVVKPGGWIAGYVWDFNGDLSAARYIGGVLREMGVSMPRPPGADGTKLDAFHRLFEATGLEAIESRPIEVTHTYANADEHWTRFVENPTPQSAFINGLPEPEKRKLRAAVDARLPIAADGTVTFAARAHAAKGRVPK